MPFAFGEDLNIEELEEELNKTFFSMRDSVRLVNEYVAGNIPGDLYQSTIRNTIRRNVEHLEIMINTKEIKQSGRDLTEFTDCIASGYQFLNN
jgi:hypothetical protein